MGTLAGCFPNCHAAGTAGGGADPGTTLAALVIAVFAVWFVLTVLGIITDLRQRWGGK
jgi:hypothetical protein